MTPRRKMQDVDFRNVEEFLDYLPERERQITERLRALLLNCIPDVVEKLSYNVPYYKRHRNICFIWPSSIPWGNVKHQGVRLGFTQGHLIQDEMGFLQLGNRKHVAWHDFHTLAEMDPVQIEIYVLEAVMLDHELRKSK